MKLAVGNVILVHGFVMLKGLNGGEKYKVAKITVKKGLPVYWFSKPRGKKIICGHYVSDIDMSMNSLNNNYIEVVK